MSLERIKHWTIKGGLGILDQGIYSGANFLLGILLARWFSPVIYGAFSAAYSIFFLFSNFQVALIAEPMSIYGAGKYRGQIVPYLNYLLRILWIGSLIGALILVLLAVIFADNPLREAMISMALALPWILLYWYLRRALYIEMQSEKALLSSLVYSVLLIIVIFLAQYYGFMSLFSAFITMALSSLIASFFALKKLGISLIGKGALSTGLDSFVVNRELWNFGKWVLPAYLAGWLTSVSFPFLISILLSAQLAGAFRAMQNLYLPYQQFLAAITLLLLPWLSKQHIGFGSGRLFTQTQFAAGISFITAFLYCFIIVFFRQQIVAILYASAYYSSFDYLVVYLGIATLLGSAPLILSLALRILNYPNTILWSKTWAALFTVLLGLPMIKVFQMRGVVFTIVGSAVIEASIVMFFYFRSKHSAQIQYHS